jgi:dipeptidase E
MRLFLTSAGIVPEVTEKFLKFLGKKPEETSLCFIITASNPEKDKWYVEKDKKRLKELGFKMIEIDLEKENEDSLRAKMEKFDVIYVEGGNTFYLLKYARETSFDKVLKDFLNKNGVYIGVSAGSYIVCPNIEMATWRHQDKNRAGLNDLTGLNFVPFLITAHFEEKYRPIIEEVSKKTNYPIIAISDQQAVSVENGKFEVVGVGEKNIFNTQTKF